MTKTKANYTIDHKDFSHFFDLSNDLLAIIDFNRHFVKLSNSWIELSGFSLNELTQEPYLNFIYPTDIDKTLKAIEGIKDVQNLITFENRILTKTGNIKWLLWKINIEYEQQKMYCLVHDITEQKSNAKQMETKTRQLVESNKELEEYAFIASHDLQEPLRKISGFIDLINLDLNDKLNDETKVYMNYVLDATNRMRTLISDLLSYSRITKKKQKFKNFKLETLIADVENELQLLIEENNARIIYKNLPVIYADYTQIFRVFLNLFTNAIRYRSKTDPEITITAEDNNSEIVIAAKDNGIGIDPRYEKRIFEIFSRLQNKNKVPGTGIGLAICKKIITSHKGRIYVKSALKEGSCFYITLPKVKK